MAIPVCERVCVVSGRTPCLSLLVTFGADTARHLCSREWRRIVLRSRLLPTQTSLFTWLSQYAMVAASSVEPLSRFSRVTLSNQRNGSHASTLLSSNPSSMFGNRDPVKHRHHVTWSGWLTCTGDLQLDFTRNFGRASHSG